MYNWKMLWHFLKYRPVIGLAASCLTLQTYRRLDIPQNNTLLIFLFFAAIAAYLFCQIETHLISKRHAIPTLIMFVTLGTSLLFFPTKLSSFFSSSSLFLIHLFLLLLGYRLPFLERFSLRRRPYIKLFLISYIWASLTVVYPIWERGQLGASFEYVILFCERFFFILSITLPFDIRDFAVDKKIKLRTLPHLIGIKKSRAFSVGLLLISYLFFLLGKPERIELYSFVAFITFLLIQLSTKTTSRFFFYFLLDGTMIVQSLIYIL